jgi:hypothetical protein
MTISHQVGEGSGAEGLSNPPFEAPSEADSGRADSADFGANSAGEIGHRLHKPGVAGSSPAAATSLSFDENIEAYHADAAWWSKSQLWDLLSHGSTYFHARHIARSVQPYAADSSLKKGTYVHEWAEQGDSRWWGRVVIIPDDALGASGRRTKKTDEWIASQKPDAILLKQEEADAYGRQFDAIRANPIFGQLSNDTIFRECSIRWVDESTGLPLKCRPDAVTTDMLWDIKTTREQNPLQTFWKSVFSYGYDFQAVHYLEGALAADMRATQFVFLVTSTVPPYQCHAVTLPQRVLDKARRKRQACLNDLHARLTFDHWLPEDSGQVTELFVPEKYMEE